MTVRIMSDKEIARLEVLHGHNHQRLTAAAAAEILELGRRQVLRPLKACRTSAVDSLISKRRGRPSNQRKPNGVRTAALAIIGKRNVDFSPTLAAEKLQELGFD